MGEVIVVGEDLIPGVLCSFFAEALELERMYRRSATTVGAVPPKTRPGRRRRVGGEVDRCRVLLGVEVPNERIIEIGELEYPVRVVTEPLGDVPTDQAT